MSKKKTIVFMSLVLAVITVLGGYLAFSRYIPKENKSTPKAQALTTNWDQVNTDGFSQNNDYPTLIQPAGDYLFAIGHRFFDGDFGTIWKYRDSTNTWTRITNDGCTGPNYARFFTAITEFNGDVYVAGRDSDGLVKVYKISPTAAADSCGDSNVVGQSALGLNAGIGLSFVTWDNKLYLYATMGGGSGVGIFRYNSGTSWTAMKTNGFSDPDETIALPFSKSCVAAGQAVYCYVYDTSSGIKSRLYKSASMTSWTQVGTDDFSDLSRDFSAIESLNGKVYVGTGADTIGPRIYSVDESSGNVTKISSAAMESSSYLTASAFSEMNGRLYAEISSKTAGQMIYRYTGTGSNWETASTAGMGDADNRYSYSMANYHNNLYLGIGKHVGVEGGFGGIGASRVYRFRDVTDPTYPNKNPANGATGVASNSNLAFQVFDDETGNDIGSLQVTVTGSVSGSHTYQKTQSLLAAASSTNARTYDITLNPDTNFTPGETVTVNLSSKDRFVNQNSGSENYSFKIGGGEQKPSTKINPDGGTFTGKVDVTFTNDRGKIYYRTDDGSWKEYTGKITLTKSTKISYYSDDNGTKEDEKSAMFYIVRPFIVTGAGPTGNPHVKTFDYRGNELSSFMAFDENIRCGIRVTTGDVDGDVDDEIIVGSGEGCAPHVRIFERNGDPKPIDFRPFHSDSRTGVDVAAGDVDGDGKDEIAMSQFRAGETWVKVYKYNDERAIVGNWLAYRPGFEFGSTVAMGDVTGDGKAEVMTAAGPTGDPHVRVFRADGQYKGDIYAFPAYGLGWQKDDVRAGMDIAAGDVDGDGKVEIAASVLGHAQSWAKVFRWNEHKNVLTEVKPYMPKKVGTNVALGDIDQDNQAELLTGPGFGGGPHVRAFEMNKDTVWGLDFFAYAKEFRGGTDLGTGNYKY